uniref:cystathionine gamma-lyase n=1 Tax=Ditylenchus dipsaci TaxID=166011 RepID=A0A915EQA8_9BILA
MQQSLPETTIFKVLYPELESHPQHSVHKKQATGMSGMISVYLNGDRKMSEDFVSHLKSCRVPGGVESLIQIPSLMAFVSVEKETRDKLGITDNLLHISVGCEDQKDLIADMDQALKKKGSRLNGSFKGQTE